MKTPFMHEKLRKIDRKPCCF